MPVISPRRLSTTTGSSSYLPPSVGGTTSSLSNLGKSSALSGLGSTYRRSSLTNSSSAYTSSYSSGGSNLSSYLPRTSYRSSLYSSSSYGNSGTTSSYRTSSYLTGGNNDTTAASRFGVSSNRYTRSGSDRESTIRKTSSSTHLNNNNNNNTTTTTATNRSKTLNSKPPIGIGSSTSSIRSTQQRTDSRSRDNSTTRTSSDNNLTYVTSKSDLNNSNSSSQSKLQQQQQQNNSNSSSSNSNGSNYNSNCNNNTNSNCNKSLSLISSSSTSSLARQVATSGLELYEKYSPAHYTPKCELARSRSLSEATSKRYNNINNNNNNDINYNDNNCIIDKNLSNSSGNVQQLLQSKDNAISKLSRQDSTTSGSTGAIVNNTSSSNNNCKTSSPSPPPSSSIKITTATTRDKDKDKDKDNTNATQLANKVNELCADNNNAIINTTTTANAATTANTTITSSVVFSTTTPHTATNIINNTNNNKILIKNINSNYQNRQTVASSVVVINHNHNNNNSAANTIISNRNTNNSSSPLKQNTLQINNILVRHCVSDTTNSDIEQNSKKFENNSNGYNTIFDLNAKYIPFTALSTRSGTVGSPGKRTTFGGTSSGFNTIANLGSRSANSSPSATRRVPRVTTVEINRSSDQINDRDLSGDRFSATEPKFFASSKESQFYSTEPPSQITATFPVPVPLPLTHPVATTSTSSASASESPSAGFVKNFAKKINHSEHSNLCKSNKNHHQSIANHQLLSSQNSAITNPVTNSDQLRRSTAATTIISKAVNSENLTPTHSVAISRDKDKISIASEQQTSLIDPKLGQLNSFDRNLKVTQNLITKSVAGGKVRSLANEPGILESPATTINTSSNNKNHSSQLASNSNTNSRNKNSITGTSINNGINKLQLTGKNTNTLLQVAKLNLKSTKQFLSNKFDDKTMTNTFSSTCCTQNLNNNNNTINTTTTKSVSSSLLSIKPTTTINNLTNDTKSTTNTNHTNNKLNSTTSAKSFFNHIDKNNLLDIRLDFTKSRIRSDDEGGANGVTNRDSVTSSSAASSIRSAVGSILGGNTAKTVNNHNGIVPQLSSYKDQNFLKCEYELARSQLVNTNESDQQNENYTKDSLDSTTNNNLNRKLNNNNNNNNKSDSNIVKNSNHEKGNKCGKNLIRPLIHKTSNIKIADKFSKLINKNNMNCLQSSPDLLDDIKFIDSDDSERHQIQQTQPQSISSGLSNVLHSDVTKSPVRTTEPTVAAETTTASITKTDFAYGKPTRNVSNSTISQLTSTLPLTSKQQRDLTNNTNNPSYSNINNSRGSTSIKYNTLNDFKRIPTSNLSNTSYGVFNNHHHHPHHHHHVVNSNSDLSANNRPASAAAANSPTTVSSNSMQLPPLQHHRSSSASPSQSMMMANHSYCTSSRESTPSSSPQLLRRRNLMNGTSTSVLINQQPQSVHHLQPPQQQQSLQAHTQTAAAGNENNFSSSSASSSSSSLMTDKKLSTKICDIDESVRNASIRSALPPSPTPSRYWDREGRSSTLSSRNINDSDDYISTKSTSDSYDKTISSENSEGLCGLRNIGNTCFMNSVIQCLSHTRELTKFLKNQVNVKSSSKDQQILSEFSKLIRDMWKPNTRSMTPLELKSAFSSKHRMYSGYNQQDAQEFLRFFLDSLHSALNTGSKGGELKIDDSLSDNKKADLTWEWYSRIENSIIRDLFVGQLKSTLKCTTCGNTSVTFDPFWDLSVPLPSSSRCKLDACLDLFIREEVLDGDEMPTCSKCQTRRKCTKSFTIQRFPKYLVIHLKRFSETRWSKLSNVVEFPTGERELNMGPYAANPTTTASYTLYAISNHMGCTAGGHYVALCRHPVSKKWHEFNDNVVSDDLSDSTLVSSSAYLLFYERS